MFLPAIAIAFHGCDEEVGEKVLSGVQEIQPSENPYDFSGNALPENQPAGKGDADLVKRYRDRLVLDFVHEVRQRDKKPAFDTVRASFPEGEALYDGAKITERSHVQICVRNPQCVLGYFRPIWDRYA